MCISKLGQIIYGVLAFGAVALIMASIFAPGFRSLTVKLKNNTQIEKVIQMDLLGLTCYTQNVNGTLENKGNFSNCVEWYKNRPTWEKVVVILMIISALAALVAFVWNVLAFFMCFCQGNIHKPLPFLALIAAVFLASSLGVYYFKNSSKIELSKSLSKINNIMLNLEAQNNISYSFYMGCGALALHVANIVVGTLIICFANSCL